MKLVIPYKALSYASFVPKNSTSHHLLKSQNKRIYIMLSFSPSFRTSLLSMDLFLSKSWCPLSSYILWFLMNSSIVIFFKSVTSEIAFTFIFYKDYKMIIAFLTKLCILLFSLRHLSLFTINVNWICIHLIDSSLLILSNSYWAVSISIFDWFT